MSTYYLTAQPVIHRTHTAETGRRFYKPELDGLRLYAFLGVFIFHAFPGDFYHKLHLPLPWLWAGLVKSGAAGVELFFALSAFLITSLLLRERNETDDISLQSFYMRRVLRIWPLYFILIALGVVLAHTTPGQNLPWYYVAGYLLFLGNWVQAVCGGPNSICYPMWTVSIEEQFYLIWPFLVKKLQRRGMIIAACAIFLLATVSRVGLVLSGMNANYIKYTSTSCCDSLALGILLALFADRLPKLSSRARLALVVGGLSSWIVSSAWLVEQPGPVDMRMAVGKLITSLGAGAILYGCLNSETKLLRGAWVVRLGKVSYGLYMLHAVGIFTMVSLLHPAWGGQLLAARMAGLVLTVVLAFAAYRWIESPFLRLKDRYAKVLSRPVTK